MINKIIDIEKFLYHGEFKKIFILCGKKSFEISGAKDYFEKILFKYSVNVFYKKSEIPVFDELKKIIFEIESFKPDLILAVGGGTVIDYAKIANTIELKTNTEYLISNYSCKFKQRCAKLIAIPTTAGSGAEITSSAVIYINKVKYSLESDVLIPNSYFLIPEFLVSAPHRVKASAGFDAIAQSIESLLSKKSNEESTSYASEALKILCQNYIAFLNRPNKNIASKMAYASHLAGKAICISRTGAPHAVSYPFTSLFNVSHGHAVSLYFEQIIYFNYLNLKKSETFFNLQDRFNLIFKLMNVKDIDEFIVKILEIKKQAKLEDNLIKLGINIKKYIHKILEGINPLRLKNNPVEINEQDISKIILRNYS